MRLFRAAALAALVMPLPAAAQNLGALCAQGTPQFPQACPCIVTRAQGAGIAPGVLARLLVNNTGGVPIATFKSYGAIYVQCLQEAVLAGSPAAPAQPPVPAPQVQPTAPAAAPRVEGARPAGDQGAPVSVFLPAPRPEGQWGPVTLARGQGVQIGAVGVQDGRGHILALRCDAVLTAQAPSLVLTGLPPGAAARGLQIEVRRGNGQVLYSGFARAHRADGAFLLMPLDQRMVQALRAGATVRFDPQDGAAPAVFGLSGSSRALGPGCASRAGQRFAYLASDLFAVDGGWSVEDRAVRGPGTLPDRVLAHAARAPAVPTIALTCDRRLAVTSAIFNYAPTARRQGEIAAEPSIALDFTDRGGTLLSQPLTDAQVARIAVRPAMNVTFDVAMEPGDFTSAVYGTAGLADGLAALRCPPEPSPGGGPVIDLSAQANAWSPADLGPVFDGMSQKPAYVPGAYFTAPGAGVPTLGMQCGGEPFVVDPWPGPDFVMRMSVDGDPARTRDVRWRASRGSYFPADGFDGLGAMILAGNTLRLTLASDPRLDIAYSLDGLRQALSAAGCP